MTAARVAGRALLLAACVSGIARAQRIAPLPPPCAVGGADTSRFKPRPPRRPVSLAVLSLSVGAGAAPYAFLSDGLADAIAARIGGAVPGIFVLGRRAQHRRPGTTASVMRTIGADLGVSYLLAGSLSRGRTNLQIALALYDAATGRPTWTRTFYYDSSGALPIEQATAIEVGSRMVGVLTPAEQQALLRVPSARHAAYEEMLRGDVAASELAHSLAGDAYRLSLITHLTLPTICSV
jgi:TolB-like protein